jgi:gliding motility-associated lipoprotein GldH
MVLLFTACKRSTVYFHFEDVPESGWEKNDLVSFDLDKQTSDATYQEELALRINSKYPFMRLTLIVEQTIYPASHTITDTLNCNLIDERGNAIAKGISQHQYLFPLKNLQLQRADSVHLSVHHNMKREILPGITSIGIKLSKKE